MPNHEDHLIFLYLMFAMQAQRSPFPQGNCADWTWPEITANTTCGATILSYTRHGVARPR